MSEDNKVTKVTVASSTIRPGRFDRLEDYPPEMQKILNFYAETAEVSHAASQMWDKIFKKEQMNGE